MALPKTRAAVDDLLPRLLDWIGSRKTLTTIATVVITIVLPQLGVAQWIVQTVAALGGLGVAGQAVADIRTGGSRR